MRNGGFAMLTDAEVCFLDQSHHPVSRFEVAGGALNWGTLSLLSNGRCLVAGRLGNLVTEYRPNGETAWELDSFKVPSAARLPNGHTLVCIASEQRIVEVDRSGKEVRAMKLKTRPWHVEVLP